MENATTNSRRRFLGMLGVGLLGALSGCMKPDPEPLQTINESVPQAAPKKDTTAMSSSAPLPTTPDEVPAGKEVATLAGGCFWCTEAIFTDLKGVEKVESGYSGGHVAKPSYEEVCRGRTGHAEAIQITFDPKAISFEQILKVFLATHDPTTRNRQGNDIGTQYRSAIFTHGDAQKAAAEKVIKEVEAEHIWPNPIVTEITPFSNFYKAEDYHQTYFARNGAQPYCRAIIAPKVAKFRDHYRELLKR